MALLRELSPSARKVGMLVNPNNPQSEPETADVHAAAQVTGQQITVLQAANGEEIDKAFATLEQLKLDALLVNPDPAFMPRRSRPVRCAHNVLCARICGCGRPRELRRQFYLGFIVRAESTLLEYSRAKGHRSAQLYSRLNLSSTSMQKPPRRSVLPFHFYYSASPRGDRMLPWAVRTRIDETDNR